MTGRQSSVAKLVLAAMLTAAPVAEPALAYQKYGVMAGDRFVILKWQRFPIRYYVSDRGVPGVSADQLRAAVARAFQAWTSAPGTDLRVDFVGFTAAPPLDEDGLSTLGFLDRPELDRVLGATEYLIDTVTGEILESDIFFNTSFSWSVADSGEAGRFDLESIAVHEIGHFLGLGHSAIGETELIASGGRRVIASQSVMFPIAFSPGSITDRTLKADDIAGIGDIYPNDDFRRGTGTIGGRITKGGQAVFGAHILAFNPRTGKLVGNFSFDDGRFAIAGLDPGPHIIRVEPVDDADLDSFFSDADDVDIDFRVTFLDRLAIVPERGSTTADVSVERK
ncbi:MAG: matrixin family metalloprotease [Vicinamibacterales bacterium]